MIDHAAGHCVSPDCALPITTTLFRLTRYPGIDGPVNKRNLSTGENGEFVAEMARRSLLRIQFRGEPLSAKESREAEPLRNVWDNALGLRASRHCQENVESFATAIVAPQGDRTNPSPETPR